jgi:hypothetical protein
VKHCRFAAFPAFFFLLLSCPVKEPPAFPFFENTKAAAYGLSRDAVTGILVLKDGKRLDYVFALPLEEPEDFSLAVEYYFDPPSLREGAGKIILETDGSSWELPQNLSFVNVPGETPIIEYAVPLPPGKYERFSFRFEAKEKIKGPEAKMYIRRVYNSTPWFGLMDEGAEENRRIRITPFVYADGDGLVIDPPERFRLKETPHNLMRFTAGASKLYDKQDLKLEAGSLRFNIRDGLPLFSMDFPFPPTGAYPLDIRGEAQIDRALISPARLPQNKKPIPADPGLVLAWRQNAWRDPAYELFSWASFPEILIFDIANYDVQDRYLKRLAFFVEKAGFRGRLAGDDEIAELHGWNAHDYRASSLADFFELARKRNFPLFQEEQELMAILLDNGVIRRGSDGSIKPGGGAIISLTRDKDCPDYLRRLFITHEGFHGIYFIDREFRDFCKRRWDAFQNPGKRFILSYFAFQAYDTKDAELMVNEFMAHLLQQGTSFAGKYFGEILPNRMINRSPHRRADLPKEEAVSQDGNPCWPEIAEAFTAEAEAFSRYVNERWGLAAGRVWKISVEDL